MKISLATAGFARTWRWLRAHCQSYSQTSDIGPTDIAVIDYAVATASALYPGRALCLEQSLVLYYLLRRSGVAVAFRMGVQIAPFVAHAWVEYRGTPINDVPEHVKWFTPLPDQVL
ncbi:MAG: lasso peptide biosynthesis B2 protein [Gemmatimonadaceae bacterium]|nr:lasso peptide biosynthesis B2 protein [Gemmatimonadaceae bacterium]